MTYIPMAEREMTREELQLNWELCLERIAQQDETILQLESEVLQQRAAITVMREGLDRLKTIAHGTLPLDYSQVFAKDFAPFRNIVGFYEGKTRP